MFANKTLQAITSVGTGAYQLNSTGTGAWKTWRSQIATGTQVEYYAENAAGTVWEFGYGTLTYGTPDQISRNVILTSTGSIIDWASSDGTVYVMSVPWAQAFEGRWDATAGMFVPAGRKSWIAVGAANKTVTPADAGGRFSLDTSAAARTVTLPAVSGLTTGFNIEIWGLSSANPIILDPAGTDAIDGTAGGTNVAVAGNTNLLLFFDGTQWRTTYRNTPTIGVPRGHIAGLTHSTAGSSATFSVSAGEATDKVQTTVMKLASALSKTTSAWSAGNNGGALDTGTIANNTWYHSHLIENLATGAVDILISASATAPTVPSGYTLTRCMGTLRTNGSAQWTSFLQVGDFFFVAQTTDYTTGGTVADTLRTLTVPTGKVVWPLMHASLGAGGGGGTQVQFAPGSFGSAKYTYYVADNSSAFGVQVPIAPIPTNTSGQIYIGVSVASGSYPGVSVNTYGWIDRRGQDD